MDAGQANQEVCVQAAVGLRQMPGSLKQESFLVVNEDSNRLIFVNKAEKGVQNPYSSSASVDQLSVSTLTPLFQLGIQGQYASDRIMVGPHKRSQVEQPTDFDCNTVHGRGSPAASTKACSSPKKTLRDAHETHSSSGLQSPSSFREGCFTFDGVFNLDTGQEKLFFEHVRPLLARIPLGYSVSLLMCDADPSGPQAEGRGFVQKVIEAALPEPSHSRDDDTLKTISFIQIYTDGTIQDLLKPGSQALQMMDLPPLGLVVEKATEMVVIDSQAATRLYVQGVSQSQESLQETLQKQPNAMCGMLLTVTLEQRAEGQGLRRAALRILEFIGRDELSCADSFSLLFSSWSVDALPAEVGFLSWVLKQLLTGNALTFVLFCLTLPEASGREVLSVLSLAEHVKSVSKRVAPTCWDPAQEAQKRREVIGELRDQLFFFSSHPEQDSRVSKLGHALKELQVLKSQSWKKERKTSAAHETKDICPETKGQITSEVDSRKEGSAAQRWRSWMAMNSISPAWSWAAQQDVTARFSLAKAKRWCLQEQHRLLIQQELLRTEEKLAGQEKPPPDQQEVLHRQKEKSVLTLRLEALQKEQAEAERDLEDLCQEHLREADAQKQHILQVFQAFKGHAEEQLDALERRYRRLLQRSLQDAVILSAQNQQLQARRHLEHTDTATQTEGQLLKQPQESQGPVYKPLE